MKVLTVVEAACELAKVTRKPILYLGFNHTDDLREIFKAAPYLSPDESNMLQTILDKHAIIVCDSDEECDKLYWQTVGDDGPTEINDYKGPAKVYALTIGSDGELLNENT